MTSETTAECHQQRRICFCLEAGVVIRSAWCRNVFSGKTRNRWAVWSHNEHTELQHVKHLTTDVFAAFSCWCLNSLNYSVTRPNTTDGWERRVDVSMTVASYFSICNTSDKLIILSRLKTVKPYWSNRKLNEQLMHQWMHKGRPTLTDVLNLTRCVRCERAHS